MKSRCAVRAIPFPNPASKSMQPSSSAFGSRSESGKVKGGITSVEKGLRSRVVESSPGKILTADDLES